ncbi:hypothetical protein EJ04DRAFT_448159 [Polyplosphaeria fusca]|uniref:Glutamyl-tRNA(Gln) amidotransferase subunit B, mitochondrial n=1 Tax=Polyplosphaeria fusca TaxID=682080 RepID=A0A9P4QKH6_9PLEO|nr:hypothetical protein EJ04DRAFT_448159 [Polyplosphaeria fusca]
MFVRPTLAALAPARPYICPSCLHRATFQPLISSPYTSALVATRRRALHTVGNPSTDHDAPFRKTLKDAAKQRKRERSGDSVHQASKASEPRLQKWELTVGIEIHAELNTARKLFSSAASSTNDAPNTHVALFDAAFPGSQPHFQIETLIPALRAALALDCEIQPKSSFDRKHYFYQDQPAGYQITQYYEPFARDGRITLHPHDFPNGISPQGGPIAIDIKQVQMEQDTAKTVHQPPATHLLDFNRVSHPLIEIITLPQIHDPTTAAACVRKIQRILRSVDACTAGMESGGLRADVNVSVRERHTQAAQVGNSYHGVTGLGQRTEIKNLASVKAVEDAIIAERDRQIDILESGGVIEGETRGWTLGSKSTKRLRGKEGEIDYRYMPDPDIAPVLVDKDLVAHLQSTLYLSTDDAIKMLTEGEEYNLTSKDASTLVSLDDGARLEYYLDVYQLLHLTLRSRPECLRGAGKVTGNWVLMELGALFKNEIWSADRVPPNQLASIISHLLQKKITGRTAKLLLSLKFQGDSRDVAQIIVDEEMALQPLSQEEYIELAQRLLVENPNIVKDIVEKKQYKKVKWFVGQMIGKAAEGKVEPIAAETVIAELLNLPPGKLK